MTPQLVPNPARAFFPQFIPDARPSFDFQRKLGEQLADYFAAADILGRLHALQQAKAKTGRDLPMSTRVALGAAFADTTVLGFESVPPEGAIRRLQNLTGYTKIAFQALRQRYRAQAFTVAGLSDVGLIEKVRDALAAVAAKGGTANDFFKAVDALTSAAGVAKLSRFQLETVFQTTLQRAYANGHFEQMKDPDVVAALPYWQYRTAGDLRVRPNHAAIDGFTARHDDIIWGRIYPPNGFNCRCTVISILAEEAPANADIPGAARMHALVPDAGFQKGFFA